MIVNVLAPHCVTDDVDNPAMTDYLYQISVKSGSTEYSLREGMYWFPL